MVKLVENSHVIKQLGSELEVIRFVNNVELSRVTHALGVVLAFHDGKLIDTEAFKEVSKFLELTELQKEVKYDGNENVLTQRIANAVASLKKDGLGDKRKSDGLIYLTEKGKNEFDDFIII